MFTTSVRKFNIFQLKITANLCWSTWKKLFKDINPKKHVHKKCVYVSSIYSMIKHLINNITTKQLELISIKNKFPNRWESSHESRTSEHNHYRHVYPIREALFRRLVCHVVQKHWQHEIEWDKPNRTYHRVYIPKERQHRCHESTKRHI